jgi:Cytochrome c oxidase subunit IV
MKVEAWLFGAGAPLFTVFAVAYGIMSHWDEPVGLAGLFLLAGLAALIGAYLGYTGRHIDPRPEDDPFGNIDQGAGELGEFAPYSWWPLAAAAGGAVIFAGMAIGVWLMLIGFGLGVIGLVGWVMEFYRGEHAH